MKQSLFFSFGSHICSSTICWDILGCDTCCPSTLASSRSRCLVYFTVCPSHVTNVYCRYNNTQWNQRVSNLWPICMVQGQGVLSILLFVLHMLPTYIVDTTILSEIKGCVTFDLFGWFKVKVSCLYYCLSFTCYQRIL